MVQFEEDIEVIVYAPEHWVCFTCRKQFRKESSRNGLPWNLAIKEPVVKEIPCAECKSPMYDMGRYFRPPRKVDRRSWQRLKLLGEHGYRFTRPDDIVIILGRMKSNTSLRDTRQQIANCGCHVRTKGQRLLKKLEEAKQRHGRSK
jgi:hypothetical protein